MSQSLPWSGIACRRRRRLFPLRATCRTFSAHWPPCLRGARPCCGSGATRGFPFPIPMADLQYVYTIVPAALDLTSAPAGIDDTTVVAVQERAGDGAPAL